jgi:hypothetical protein
VLGLASLVAKRLDELQVLAGTGAGDLEEHAPTLQAYKSMSSNKRNHINVPLQRFSINCPQTRMATWGGPQKTPFLPPNCRTRGVTDITYSTPSQRGPPAWG